MSATALSRRDLLLKCAALGALTVAPGLSLADALAWGDPQAGATRPPTPWDEIGPFYKRDAPHLAELRAPGDPGVPLSVSGRVFDTRGHVLEGASIEIWQANDAGIYDLDGYRYRDGACRQWLGKVPPFGSVMPGHYPPASASTCTIW